MHKPQFLIKQPSGYDDTAKGFAAGGRASREKKAGSNFGTLGEAPRYARSGPSCTCHLHSVHFRAHVSVEGGRYRQPACQPLYVTALPHVCAVCLPTMYVSATMRMPSCCAW